MWVLSQNKETLIKCNSFKVDWTDMNENDECIEFSYCVWGFNDTQKCKLGIYSTKRKAMFVLEMIAVRFGSGYDLIELPSDEEVSRFGKE